MALVAFSDALAAIQAEVDRHLADRPGVEVLDGGCGASGRLRLPESAHLTGIDISETEVSKNSRVDRQILGDLQTYPLESGVFALGICWDVLEHLSDPLSALTNMRRALAPEGILIIGAPNPLSLKGLVTKFTPHWFHRLFYKRLMHSEREPFETFMRWTLTPRSISAWASRSNMTVDHLWLFESDFQQRLHSRIPHWLWRLFCKLAAAVTAGRLHLDETDFIMLLRSEAQDP